MKYLLTCLFKYNLYNRQTSERNYLTDLPRSGGYIYGFQCKLASRRQHNKFLSQNRMLRYRQINVRLLLPASKCLKMHILVLCCDGNPKNQFQELKPLAKHLSSLSWMKPEDGFILWLLWICKSAVNGLLLVGEACILVYCSARSAAIYRNNSLVKVHVPWSFPCIIVI